MTNELLWNYAFNILVNGPLAFLTVAILVELFLFVIRVKHPRVKVLCRCIPVVKVALDLFLYDFSAWSLSQGVNPLEAETGTRMISGFLGYPLMTSGILFWVNDVKTFTLADLIALSIDPFWVKAAVLSAVSITITLCIRKALQYIHEIKWLKGMLKTVQPSRRRIQNTQLRLALKRVHVCIGVSPEVDAPCAIGILKKWIIYPTGLIEKLTQEEFEAIMAHELEHLRWYDAWIRMVFDLICSLFWWIPTGWWIRHLEHSQEYACDNRIDLYSIPRHALASAIIKSAKIAKAPTPMLATSFVGKGFVLKRIKALHADRKPSTGLAWIKHLLIGAILLNVFFGRFWIF